MKLLEIVFWTGTLVAWCALVAHGIKWVENRLDRFLDRWFEPVNEGDEDRHAWPDYLDKK